MDGADGWTDIAAEWHELWGDFARPVHESIASVTNVTEGMKTLDVGCGSGEFMTYLRGLGADAHGVDPAAGMVAIAGDTAQLGDAEHLPWPDASFDLVTAINALQFAEDTMDALTELQRVTRPGGYIAIANWAEAARNDIDAVEKALSDDDETESDEGELRAEGGLVTLLTDAGFELVEAHLVEADWHASDDDILVRGVLLGADQDTQQEFADAVKLAAQPFRSVTGGYVLHNALRLVVVRRI